MADGLFDKFISVITADTDVKRIINTRMVLNTPEGFFDIDRILHIDINSDFVNDVTDRIAIRFQIPKGDFFKFVVPNKEELTANITIETLGKVLQGKFKAKIDPRLGIKKEQAEAIPLETLNLSLIEVTLECLEESVLNLKKRSIDGVFPAKLPKEDSGKITVTDVILGNLSVGTGPVVETFASFGFGVKMVAANNTRQYEHIIVPTGTKLLGLPDLLQERYGVYNGEINTYKRVFDNTSLYIYPPYRTNLFGMLEDTLQIIGVNEDRLKGNENTYVRDGTTIRVLTVREPKSNDNDNALKNKGVKIQSTEADTLIHRPIQITPKELKIKKDDIIKRTQHRKLKDGDTPIIDGGVTNNHYRLRSKVLATDGFYLQIIWNHANTRLLKPMMSVTYIEEKDGDLQAFEGLLHKIHTVYDNDKKVEHAVLFVFVKPKENPSRPQVTQVF